MDTGLTLSLLPAPQVMPDLRPAADAAASARQDRPPATLAPAHPLPCPALQAHALRSLLSSEGAGTGQPDAVDPPRRVLKPFGIEMLPSERRQEQARTEPQGALPPARGA